MIQDETITKVAKRDMEGVVPLYYEMIKAEASLLTSERMYEALTSAYKANIGIISNEITKIWNNDNPNVDAVKWLCMISNFTIDYAKTLYMPTNPEHVDEELKKFSKGKLPHFFKYAKDKLDGQIDKLNNSTVNKLNNIIPNKPIQFKKVSGNVNHELLMKNKYADSIYEEELIEKFIYINRNKRFYVNEEDYNEHGFIIHLKEQLFKICNNEQLISDILVRYFYLKDSAYKVTLWSAYGEYIYKALESNLEGTVCCEKCNNRVNKDSKKQIYCKPCSVIVDREKAKLRKKNNKKVRF